MELNDKEALRQYRVLRPEGSKFLNAYIFMERPSSAGLTEKLQPLMKHLPPETEEKTVQEILDLSNTWAKSQSILAISNSPDCWRSESIDKVRTAIKTELERIKPLEEADKHNLYHSGSRLCLEESRENFLNKDVRDAFSSVEAKNKHSVIQYDAEVLDAMEIRRSKRMLDQRVQGGTRGE